MYLPVQVEGGYFIVKGKEKTIISHEKLADNVPYVKKCKIETEERNWSIKIYLPVLKLKVVTKSFKKVFQKIYLNQFKLFVTIAEKYFVLATYHNILISISS